MDNLKPTSSRPQATSSRPKQRRSEIVDRKASNGKFGFYESRLAHAPNLTSPSMLMLLMVLMNSEMFEDSRADPKQGKSQITRLSPPQILDRNS